MMIKRCVVYAKDVSRITGKSVRYGQLVLRKARDFFQKSKEEYVTVDEFSQFSRIPVPLIMEYMD